jgi:SAM-dependent methyltransferase
MDSAARDWDRYYAGAADLDWTPAPLLVEIAELLPPGRALDIACGAGRNAIYLSQLGWDVTAVDSSPVAIRLLRERAAGLAIDARVADLEAGEFPLEPAAYDLICDFFYLQRSLFPAIRESVRPGGVFAGAIHLADGKPHRFVLRPGELREEFAGWKILFYSESTEPASRRPTARIVARHA